MEKIHVGLGVFRSAENTQLFEVYTDEQMQLMKDGKGYEWLNKNKMSGGFHGIKVLAFRKMSKGTPVGGLKFENLDLISREQAAVIKSITSQGKSPEVVYEYGSVMGVKHDHSNDIALAVPSGLPAERSEGTNIDPDDNSLDESFIGGDDAEPDGHTGDGPEASPIDGETAGGDEPGEQSEAAKPTGKPGKKQTSKRKSAGKGNE